MKQPEQRFTSFYKYDHVPYMPYIHTVQTELVKKRL
jgi:hypothetical protein